MTPELFDAPPPGGDVYPSPRSRVYVFNPDEVETLIDELAEIGHVARQLTAEPKGSKRSAELFTALGGTLGWLARQFDIDEVILADRITRREEVPS